MTRLNRTDQFNQVQQSFPILPNQRTILFCPFLFFYRLFFRPLILPLLGGISCMFSRSTTPIPPATSVVPLLGIVWI